MQVTLTPTAEIQRINGEPARVWIGADDHGTPVKAFIRMVQPQTHDPEANERFARELTELGKAERAEPINVRHVI